MTTTVPWVSPTAIQIEALRASVTDGIDCAQADLPQALLFANALILQANLRAILSRCDAVLRQIETAWPLPPTRMASVGFSLSN